MELKDAVGFQIPGQGFTTETIQFYQFGIQLIDSGPRRSVLLEGRLRLSIEGESSDVKLGEDLEALRAQLALLPNFLGLEMTCIKVFGNGLLEILFASGKIETYDNAWEIWGMCTPDQHANFLEGASSGHGSSLLKDYSDLLRHEPTWTLF